MAAIMPKLTATPLPPLKLKNIGNNCPKNTAKAVNDITKLLVNK